MKNAGKIVVLMFAILFVVTSFGSAFAENYTGAEFNAALKLNKTNLKKVDEGERIAFKQDNKVVLIGHGHDADTVAKVKKARSGGWIYRTGKKTYEIDCIKGHCDGAEFEDVMDYCGVKKKNINWR